MQQGYLFGPESMPPAKPKRRRHDAFVKAPLAVQRSRCSRGAKDVYEALLSFAWQSGRCHPSQVTLASAVAASVRMVRRWLKELVDRRLIEVEQRGLRQSNSYTLLPVEGAILGDLAIVKTKAPDRTRVSSQDRTRVSSQDRTRVSGPMKEEIDSVEADAFAAAEKELSTKADCPPEPVADIACLRRAGVPCELAELLAAQEPSIAADAVACLVDRVTKDERRGLPPPDPIAFLRGLYKRPWNFGLERVRDAAPGQARWRRPPTAAERRSLAIRQRRDEQRQQSADLLRAMETSAAAARESWEPIEQLWELLPAAEQEAIRAAVIRGRPKLAQPEKAAALRVACLAALNCRQASPISPGEVLPLDDRLQPLAHQEPQP